MYIEEDRSHDATVAELSPAELAQVSGGSMPVMPIYPWWWIQKLLGGTVCK